MVEERFEAQLLGLSPSAKIGVGIALALGCGIATVALWESGWVWGLTIFGFCGGLASLGIGWRERQRERAFTAELARAKAEWSELERDLRAARATGGSPTRVLQQRGYREYHIRRWILRELQLEP